MSTNDAIRAEIWRAVFPSGTTTTAAIALKLCVKTRQVYGNARALARKRFVTLTPPIKPGQPAALSLHPSRQWLADQKS